MGSYLQQYGVGEEHRNRMIKRIVLAALTVLILFVAGYFFFHNYPEKRIANGFLSQINSKEFKNAYQNWGCTDKHPCPNYDYQRFLRDWGPESNASGRWQVVSTEGCKSFVTVNVQARGAELQSLAIQRNDHSLGFAPAPECQERQWRWGQFFQRIFHRSSS